MMKKWKP